jgi:hypothetical protein
MMDRIPGLSEGGFGGGSSGGFRGGPPGGFSRRGGGSGGRGFGGGSRGSEILINGKRTAGKNNSTGSQLRRITADQVDYIEIIRGTSGELDVRGSGQVVNVVLFESFSTSTVQYEALAEQSDDNTVSPSASLSYSGQRGALNFQLSARAGEVYMQNLSKENSILGDFSPNDLIREESATQGDNSTLSTNLDYQLNGNSSARFNAQYTEGDGDTKLFRRTTDLKLVPNVSSMQREESPSSIENWEVGGDYEYNNARAIASRYWRSVIPSHAVIVGNAGTWGLTIRRPRTCSWTPAAPPGNALCAAPTPSTSCRGRISSLVRSGHRLSSIPIWRWR